MQPSSLIHRAIWVCVLSLACAGGTAAAQTDALYTTDHERAMQLTEQHALLSLYQRMQSDRQAAGLSRSDYNVADMRDDALDFLSQTRPDDEVDLIGRMAQRAYESRPVDWQNLRIALQCAEVGTEDPRVAKIATALVYQTPKIFDPDALPSEHPLLDQQNRDWGSALMATASAMRILAFQGATDDAEELIRQTKAATYGMEGQDHEDYDNGNVKFWLRYQALLALQFLPIDRAIDAYERVSEDYSDQASFTGHQQTYALIMWQAVQYNLVSMLQDRDSAEDEPVTGLPLLRFEDN